MSWKLRIVLVLAFAAAFFAVNQAFAQSTDSCQQISGSWYKFRPNPTFFGGVSEPFNRPSGEQACQEAKAWFCGANPGNSWCDDSWSYVVVGDLCNLQGPPDVNAVDRQVQTDPATQCPADPVEVECELPVLPEAGIANFAPTVDELDSIACDVSTHCLVSKRPGTTTCSSSTCGAVFSYTDIGGGGVACDGLTVPADDTPPELASPDGPPAPAERCSTNGDAEYCVNTGTPDGNDAQCGFLNDRFICVDATPQNGCQSVGDIGVLCDPAAATPPAPNSGTPGDVATPDGQVGAAAHNGNTTNNYNFFDNDTITNSTVGATTGQVDRGNDQDGDGYTDENEEESPGGTASGGSSCESPPACEGDQIACMIAVQQWRARCPDDVSAETMLDAIDATPQELEGFAAGGEEVDVGTLDSAGFWSPTACPSPLNITVMGHAISMNVWQGACSMATLFAPFVLAMGYLLAAYVFIGKGST